MGCSNDKVDTKDYNSSKSTNHSSANISKLNYKVSY